MYSFSINNNDLFWLSLSRFLDRDDFELIIIDWCRSSRPLVTDLLLDNRFSFDLLTRLLKSVYFIVIHSRVTVGKRELQAELLALAIEQKL